MQAWLFFILLSTARAEVINETLAQVGDHVITSREVTMAEFVEKALALSASKKAPNDSYWTSTSPKSKNYENLVAQDIFETILFLEAKNFNVSEIPADEIKKRSDSAKTALGGAGASWKRLDASSAELESTLIRKLRAKSFLKFKTESTGVIVTDDEAKNYFEKNKAKFGQFPFSQFKQSIKEYLEQEQLQIKLKDWYELLKRKYKLRILTTSNDVKPAANLPSTITP